jgi:hypothetical protein
MAFLTAPALGLRGARAPACDPRRRVTVRCAAAASSSQTPAPGDEPDAAADWLDMAREMGAVDEREGDPKPSKSPPQWTFPEGDDFSTPAAAAADPAAGDGRLADPWSTWRSAVERDAGFDAQELAAQRDPVAETDFWRGAARDVVPAAAAGSEAKGEPPCEPPYEPPSDPPSDPRELWGAATRVTASVADLQESLREEIESFNPLQKSDAYRDIARELVGPSGPRGAGDGDAEDRDDSVVAERPGSAPVDAGLDAAAGTGWDPDVDWKRFDDVNRELQLKADAVQRAESRAGAERARLEAVDAIGMEAPLPSPPGGDTATYLDADGRVLSAEEVAQALAEGAQVVDEDGNEVASPFGAENERDAPAAPLSPSEPGRAAQGGWGTGASFPTAQGAFRPGSGRTYGPDALGAEEELKWLQERGFDRRDPEADRALWRSAAREVGIASGDSGGDEPAAEENVAARRGDADEAGVEGAAEPMDGAPRTLEPEGGDANVDTASAWAAWSAGRQAWAEDVESAPPRDAQAEVDMWRSTARAIVTEPDAAASGGPGAGAPEGTSDAPAGGPADDASPWSASPSAAAAAASASADEANPWDAWNSAAAAWQSDFDRADSAPDDSGNDATDVWRRTARDMSGGGDRPPPQAPATAPPAEAEAWTDPTAWKSAWPSTPAGREPNLWSTKGAVQGRSPRGGDAGDWVSAARDLAAGGAAADVSGVDAWKDAAREVGLADTDAGGGAAADAPGDEA